MARTPSAMIELGQTCPPFRLPDPSGQMHGLEDVSDAKAVLVMFICNHCPFVKHLADPLAALVHQWQPEGLATFAIQSNDIETYPQDGPAAMAEEIAARGYRFPYLLDEDQSVARAFGATCTPDFFLYDQDRRLVYRGQFDETRPDQGEPHGADLDTAIEAVLEGRDVPEEQHPSIGCNIKWKPGSEPEG